MMKETIIVAVALLLSACATGSNHAPKYTYNEIMVINNSQESIQNLKISSVDSSNFFSCENIAALGVCLDRFSPRRYKEGAFGVDWVFGDSVRQTSEVGIGVPAYFTSGLALRVVLTISPEGTLSTSFEQETKF